MSCGYWIIGRPSHSKLRVVTRDASIDPFGREASELSIFGESFDILDHALLMLSRSATFMPPKMMRSG
jgi:hypothetical protein